MAEVGNWQGLCENLNVNKGLMNMLRYSSEHSYYKKSDCLKAYFNQDEAIWEEVVLAVAQYPVNNTELARNIAQKYIIHEPNQIKILTMLQCCN